VEITLAHKILIVALLGGVVAFLLLRRALATRQERERVYHEMQLRNRELESVYQVSQEITSSLELNETLQTILERVRQIIAYDGAEITLLDEEEKVLRVRAWAGSDRVQVDTRGKTYRLGEGYTGWIGTSRKSLLIPDMNAHTAHQATMRETADGMKLRGFMGAPLIVRQRLVGTIELISHQPNFFDERTLHLLETIAPYAAIAIGNAGELLSRERRWQAEMELLRIEIDENRRAKQVSEITETEYFRRLAEKSRLIRRTRAEK